MTDGHVLNHMRIQAECYENEICLFLYEFHLLSGADEERSLMLQPFCWYEEMHKDIIHVYTVHCPGRMSI